MLVGILDFTTLDGQHVAYVEGVIALHTGHAILVSGFLVGCPRPGQQVATESYIRYCVT